MALKILQPGIEPAGQFDMEDGYQFSVLGGEIGTVTSLPRVNTAAEKAAFDVRAGYTNSTDLMRVGVTTNISENGLRPLWLLDDGTAGYGTLFGQTIGTPVGIGSRNVVIGPHTASGSGKVTVWNKPGLYGVTLDATDLDATLGLQPTNPTLRPGSALFPMSNGRLTPTIDRAAGGPVGADVVARFIEFRTSANYLVTTPISLVETNPVEVFAFAVIEYRTEA